MPVDAGRTTFVTGAAGFIGAELLEALTARGHRVFGLAESMEAAERVRRAGAVPVMGDLLERGRWQDEAAADWVFHLPPHQVWGPRLTRQRASSLSRARVLMDSHLLDAVAGGATRRIVYVADVARACGSGPTRVRFGALRLHAGRRRVLEHPTARDRVPLPISHARAGSPAGSSGFESSRTRTRSPKFTRDPGNLTHGVKSRVLKGSGSAP